MLPLLRLPIPIKAYKKKKDTVKQFLTKAQTSLPLVIKKDFSSGGADVRVVHDEHKLNELLATWNSNIIIQKYTPNREFTVFYYRYPNTPTGVIFGVAEGEIPIITGDGTKTVEQLIGEHSLYCYFKEHIYAKNKSILNTVPCKNETVKLARSYNYGDGAILKDYTDKSSESFKNLFTNISNSIPGFYYGRYDIKADSETELFKGNFQILEVNGIWSAPKHCVDYRKYPATDMVNPNNNPIRQKIFLQLMEIAVDIGYQNYLNGILPISVFDFLTR